MAVNCITQDSTERLHKVKQLLELLDHMAQTNPASYYDDDKFQQAARYEQQRKDEENKRVRREMGEEQIRQEVRINITT
jgi:hypothetical protein